MILCNFLFTYIAIWAALLSRFSIKVERPLLADLTSHQIATSVPTYHTNLSTLLPILPFLTVEPSGALLVTLVTPAFKSLFLNWLCFLRFKAKWGFEDKLDLGREPYKVLVLTSDEGLAQELSAMGIVVWLRSYSIASTREEEGRKEVQENIQSSEGDFSLTNSALPRSTVKSKIIKWGSISYQSLMLERSMAIATLVESITKMNKARDYLDKVASRHNVLSSHRRVRGVLLVDNDSVWLSSPSQFLVSSEFMTRSIPTLIHSLDSPPTSLSAWGTIAGIPCACFVYTVTSSDGVWSRNYSTHDRSVTAALVWRSIALCHVALLRSSLTLVSPTPHSLNLDQLRRVSESARAPSFQSNCLGPALYIAEHSMMLPTLPSLSQSDWDRLLQTDTADILMTPLNDTSTNLSLLEIAKSISTIFFSTSKASSQNLRHHRPNSIYQYMPLKIKSLPLQSFPSGQQFFLENGRSIKGKPVVVHANYILGKEKENSLRKKKLWALRGFKDSGWSCDLSIMTDA